MGTTQITIRVPDDLLNRVRTRSARSSSYIIEAVRDRLDRDDKAEIEASLAFLAFDEDANDISDFAPAQRRVMERGD